MRVSFQTKAGATFTLSGVLTQDDGTAVDITSVQMLCQVNDTLGTSHGQLTYTPTLPTTAGVFTLSAPSSMTAKWPIGLLSADVCFVDDGATIYSETFSILVGAAITPPPAAAGGGT